jgi:hypothetical protein
VLRESLRTSRLEHFSREFALPCAETGDEDQPSNAGAESRSDSGKHDASGRVSDEDDVAVDVSSNVKRDGPCGLANRHARDVAWPIGSCGEIYREGPMLQRRSHLLPHVAGVAGAVD